MPGSVYLAGPISGLTYAGATDWRDYASEKLLGAGLTPLDPMRGKSYFKDFLGPDGKFDGSADYARFPLSGDRAIVARDHFDVVRADVVLVNLLGATTVSIGTMFEMAWRFGSRQPLVLVMERGGNLHDHSFVREAVGWRTDKLDTGLQIVYSILGA